MSYVASTHVILTSIDHALDVVIEHGTESKSGTSSPRENMSNSNSNSNINIEAPENEENAEPVVKRELLLLLPDRTQGSSSPRSSPRLVTSKWRPNDLSMTKYLIEVVIGDSGTRSARKASKILGESLTPKKDLANSHREPLYKEGKKSHRDKDKDKEKDKDRDDEPKEHKDKEHKKKKEDKN